MLKVTDEMLTGMEEIFKTQLQASDVWNAETEEMQLEIYYSEGRYRVLRFRKCFEESNI